MSERLVAGAAADGDVSERSLRPLVLDEFIGQAQARSNLRIFIYAARARAEASARPHWPRSSPVSWA